ncbi:carbonic anhydrase [Promicromonospora kroppenstedtii]|uniref:carbonic anhydrase n=1 Tax=Promicromonospora kroppenstedtii TaxID=440482 RepID=UPI0004B8BF8F|nr:carbonic anhydrase [Promicromonospora kroppenstedtii]
MSTNEITAPLSPREAWTRLREGNDRFVADTPAHPSQNADRRRELQAAQHPHTVIFGCSDSRVAAEIIFDQGLGDVFVVRTAGHVVDTTVVGSIEYGVEVLGASLVVVLGHDSCGAVAAAAHTLSTGEQPPGFVRAVVDRVIPSIASITSGDPAQAMAALSDQNVLRREHVKHTVDMLHGYSAALADAVKEGRCAVVGLEYDLAEGSARMVNVIGEVGEQP